MVPVELSAQVKELGAGGMPACFSKAAQVVGQEAKLKGKPQIHASLKRACPKA